MSTHILADVERVCDTVGIINRGKLVIEARQDQLIQQYAVPAFEIETETGFVEPLTAWAARLRQLSWITTVSIDGRMARVVVSDLETAKHELMASAAEAGLVLTRYEIVRPSLEDVFLKLVADEET
jgi:ABC-2 type transport system ATP-binding protein